MMSWCFGASTGSATERPVGALRWLVRFDKLSDLSNHKLSDQSNHKFSDRSSQFSDREVT